MPNGFALPTEASSTLPSPTSATAEAAEGRFPDIGGDIEKQSFNEREDFRDESSAEDTQTQSTRAGSLAVRVSTGLLQSLACFATSPEISRQRKEDSERKLVQRIDDHPKGYPQLAAFIDSDENFSIFRKYGFLRNRVLLYRQDELAEMERNLIAMDEDDSETNPGRLQCRTMDEEADRGHTGDPIYTRKGLIKAIDEKLKEYDDALQRLHFLSSLRPPTARNTASFTNWNLHYKPLAAGDASFLSHRSDMVSLAPTTESNRLDGFVEDCLMTFLPQPLLRRFLTSEEQKLKSNDGYIRLFSKKRVEILVRLILITVVVSMLVGPSAVLFLWGGHAGVKVGLICLFTLMFALAIGVCTRAKRHEMLAATATYAAVLVVFLGNFGPTCSTASK